MTKSLTEKWKDGELPDGYYYIDYDTQQKIFEVEDGCATYQGLPAETYFLNDVCLIKVIAPVPSYDEYKKLQEQLNEANEALKYFAETTIGHKQKDGTYGMWLCSGEVAWDNPLERIKSRIDYVCYDPRPAKNYLKKWGVK